MRSRGFTIVELLIVIVVIGILAGITIVAYNGVQGQAQSAAAKNDLRQFATIVEQYKVDNGHYPETLVASLGIKFNRDVYGLDQQNRNARYCYNEVTGQYIIFVGTKSLKYFRYTNTGGLEERNYAHGYAICSQIGLTNTNPVSDGLYYGSWSSWVNP